MIFTRPVRRKVAAPSGPITIDDVRDGAPANWAGPVNPAAVMLFDSSGTDWYNSTDYNLVLSNGANYKSGTDGGLDFPQASIPTLYDFATTSGLFINRAHATGPWSFLFLVSVHDSLAPYEFVGRYGGGTNDRVGFAGSAANFAFPSMSLTFTILKSEIPFTKALGVRYEPSEPFATRGKKYIDGIEDVQTSIYVAAQYAWTHFGHDPNFNFPSRCTIHAFIRWDYEITHQEMLDATADPDSLFAAA